MSISSDFLFITGTVLGMSFNSRVIYGPNYTSYAHGKLQTGLKYIAASRHTTLLCLLSVPTAVICKLGAIVTTQHDSCLQVLTLSVTARVHAATHHSVRNCRFLIASETFHFVSFVLHNSTNRHD